MERKGGSRLLWWSLILLVLLSALVVDCEEKIKRKPFKLGGKGNKAEDDSDKFEPLRTDKQKEREVPPQTSNYAILKSPPGWQLKKYPGVKDFSNSYVNRYPRKVLKTEKGSPPTITVYDENNAVVATKSLSTSTSAVEIINFLEANGIYKS